MFLTQLMLDRMDRRAMKVLADIYRLHQFIMSGFSIYEQPPRVLFRVEPEVKGRTIRVLVQSQVRPAWKKKEANQGFTTMIQVKEIVPQFQKGVLYQFRLRANPVVTRNGKRYGLIRDEALCEWLQKKERSGGASFFSILPIDEGYITGTRRKQDRLDRIRIKTVRFEGFLRVTDPISLMAALADGIGKAKAFGCGLLSLARA